MVIRFIAAIEEMPKKDLEDNRAIGEAGAEAILASQNSQDPVRIITHCNTGSLATSAYGTALGVIRSLFARDKIGETLNNHNHCLSIVEHFREIFLWMNNQLYENVKLQKYSKLQVSKSSGLVITTTPISKMYSTSAEKSVHIFEYQI